MYPLRNLSLRGKLTAIIMITSSVAVLVACTVFALYDVTTFWRSLESELGTVAEITGSNMTAALTFGDVKAANSRLRRRFPTRLYSFRTICSCSVKFG